MAARNARQPALTLQRESSQTTLSDTNRKAEQLKKLLVLSMAIWWLWPVVPADATDVVKRLRITPWTAGRSVTGVVDCARASEPLNGGADRYIVHARRGQHVIIGGVSDNPAIVRVWDRAYEKGVIFSEQASDIKADVRVPIDGDYFILVSAAPGVNRLEYQYTVTLR